MTAADLPIPGEWIVQGGAVGLLAVVVLMILTGRLVPRSMYKAIIEDRDYWRTVALKASAQVDELKIYGKITTETMRSLAELTKADHEEAQ